MFTECVLPASSTCCLLLGLRGLEKFSTLPASERISDCESLDWRGSRGDPSANASVNTDVLELRWREPMSLSENDGGSGGTCDMVRASWIGEIIDVGLNDRMCPPFERESHRGEMGVSGIAGT